MVRLPGVSHDSDLVHPDLVVTKNQAPVAARTLYCVGGIGPKANMYINNPDINTLKTALLTRMFYCKVNGEFVAPPQPDQRVVDHALLPFKNKLYRILGRATPLSLDQVVETYKGRKLKIYQNALESLDEKPLQRSDATSIIFVKCEKVKKESAPRCIQPRNPRYNLVFGKYIKACEKKLYKKIAKVFGDGPTVIKGYNVQDIAGILYGKWNSFANPVAIGLDATKFDMHVSVSMLEWEHNVYRRLFGRSKELDNLLSWQMNNIGKGYCDDGKLRYKVKGRRFSGDMNTALGNCLLMCAMIYSYASHKGISVKLMNNGDDCMAFMEKHDEQTFRDGLENWFLDVGFRMVVEPSAYIPEAIEFCQMRPIMTINGPIMVRNIPTSMAKDAMSIVPLETDGAFRKWLGAVGECGLALTRGVPVVSAYYRMMERNGVVSGNIRNSVQFRTGIHMLMGDLKLNEDEITEEARTSVYSAWGLTPDYQIAIESDMNRIALDYGDEIVSDHDEHQHYALAYDNGPNY